MTKFLFKDNDRTHSTCIDNKGVTTIWENEEPSANLSKSCAVFSFDTLGARSVDCNERHQFICSRQGKCFL